MRRPLSWIIALIAGGIVLIGYFLAPFIPALGSIQALVLQWAVLLAAFALLVGVINLLAVHWHKVKASKAESLYSAVLILSLVATVAVVAWNGPTGRWSLWVFNYIQVPIESSLAALLAIVLVYAAARMLRSRTDTMSIIFIAVAIIVLLGATPWYGIEKVSGLKEVHSVFKEIAAWINQTWATAGARGILLGVALGTIATGIRILFGTDHPYGG